MAREAGPVCYDPSPEPGRGSCSCGCPPNHSGNLHWCFGVALTDPHAPHSWPIVGREIPIKAIVTEETQCPVCRSVFKLAPTNLGENIVVIGEDDRVKLPIFAPKPVQEKINGA